MTDTTDAVTETTNLLEASDDELRAMGLPPAFSLEELQSFLSAEEIARLNEDDPIVAIPEKAPAAEDDPDEEDQDEGDDDGDDGEDGQNGDDGAADEGKAAATDAAEAPAFQDDTPDPVYQPRDVSEAKALIDGAAAERAKLREAWNDGDLSDEELEAKTDDLNDRIADAKFEIREAERDDKAAQSNLANVWYGKVDRFMEANPAFKSEEAVAGLDGDSYLTLFDRALRAVSSDARYASLSLNERIEAGARITQAYVKQKTGADMPTGGAAKPEAKPEAKPADPREVARKKVAEQGKRPDPVQTLGNVTAATETEADRSRFASIDRETNALASERAFERLSPEEQEAFLLGA